MSSSLRRLGRFRSRLAWLLGSVAIAASAPAQPEPAPAPEPSPSTALHLTLPDAVRLALSANQQIRASGFTPRISGAEVLQAYGAFDPSLNLSFTHSEDGSPQPTDPFGGNRPPSSIVETDAYDISLDGLTPWGLSYSLGASTQNQRGTFNNFADNYYSFAGLRVTQPLLRGFGFGATLAPLRLAKADHRLSAWEFRQTVIDTITDTLTAYHELHYAREAYRITSRSRDLASGLVSENEKRLRAGSMSEYDVTSARARAARREEAILVSARSVRDQENFLKAFVSSDRSLTLLDAPIEIAPPEAPADTMPDPAADFPRALALRPDYQRARTQLEQARLGRTLARSQALPRVDLVGSLGYNGLDTTFGASRDQVFDRDSRTYAAGAIVSVPLTFATERGRARAARLRTEQAAAQIDALEQRIVVLVGNAAGRIETARARVTAARGARALAQQTLDAEVKKLRAGTGSTFFVLEQQELLADAELRALRAEADLRIALAAYDRVLGTTLERWQVTLEE